MRYNQFAMNSDLGCPIHVDCKDLTFIPFESGGLRGPDPILKFMYSLAKYKCGDGSKKLEDIVNSNLNVARRKAKKKWGFSVEFGDEDVPLQNVIYIPSDLDWLDRAEGFHSLYSSYKGISQAYYDDLWLHLFMPRFRETPDLVREAQIACAAVIGYKPNCEGDGIIKLYGVNCSAPVDVWQVPTYTKLFIMLFLLLDNTRFDKSTMIFFDKPYVYLRYTELVKYFMIVVDIIIKCGAQVIMLDDEGFINTRKELGCGHTD